MVDSTQVYDIWSPAARAHPHPVYAQMRQENPVYQYPQAWGNRMPIWVLTRYDDCVMFLKDDRFGKAIHQNLPPATANSYWTESDPDDPWVAINKHMLNLDPPDHTRLRTLVHKAFTPRMVENLRPRIHTIASDLLDAMGEHGTGDLLNDFAFPLPVTVIAEMLGIPAADREQFRRWTKLLVFGGNPEENFGALMEFGGYMNNMINARREDPQDDIISALVQAEEDGDKLDHMELLSMLFLLLVAGHETTVNLIGNGTLALLQNRDQFDKLRANPELIRSAVEEMLRYNGPVDMTTTRWTFADVDVGGTVIPKGQAVWASLLAANRDPAQFPDPDRFDIKRDPNKHIAFGNGIHYCVGAPLARLEGTIALNALVQRRPQLELAVPIEDLEWTTGIMILHGMLAMPVRY
jgi:cytochrome P450